MDYNGEYNPNESQSRFDGESWAGAFAHQAHFGTSPRFIEKPFIVLLSSYLFIFLGFKISSLFI